MSYKGMIFHFCTVWALKCLKILHKINWAQLSFFVNLCKGDLTQAFTKTAKPVLERCLNWHYGKKLYTIYWSDKVGSVEQICFGICFQKHFIKECWFQLQLGVVKDTFQWSSLPSSWSLPGLLPRGPSSTGTASWWEKTPGFLHRLQRGNEIKKNLHQLKSWFLFSGSIFSVQYLLQLYLHQEWFLSILSALFLFLGRAFFHQQQATKFVW